MGRFSVLLICFLIFVSPTRAQDETLRAIGARVREVGLTGHWSEVIDGRWALVLKLKDANTSRCTEDFGGLWQGTPHFRVYALNFGSVPTQEFKFQRKGNKDPDTTRGKPFGIGDTTPINKENNNYLAESGFDAKGLVSKSPDAALLFVEEGLDLKKVLQVMVPTRIEKPEWREAVLNSTEGQSALLARFSPIWIADEANPYMSAIGLPLHCIDGGRILRNRTIPVTNPYRTKPDDENTVWTALELLRWSKANSLGTKGVSLEPCDHMRSILRNERKNPGRRASGEGAFGHVRSLGKSRYSVKYFQFFSYNETAFADNNGNHEGDWICVDLQVQGERWDSAKIEYAIVHDHGRQVLVDAKHMRFTSDGRPMFWLEEGTNEPWACPGSRGYGGFTVPMKFTKLYPHGEDQESEHKVVRHHRGGGQPYDTLNKIRELRSDSQDADVQFLFSFQGYFGVEQGESLSFISGQNVTNPESPPWQAKMWERAFVAKSFREDPRTAPDVWKTPGP